MAQNDVINVVIVVYVVSVFSADKFS